MSKISASNKQALKKRISPLKEFVVYKGNSTLQYKTRLKSI